MRIIAATHRDLAAEVKAGRFREDLFYRINVLPIHIPPLRDAPRGHAACSSITSSRATTRASARTSAASRTEARKLLLEYAWPGNVRELENTIERAMVLAEGDVIEAQRSARARPRGARPGAGAARERRALDQEDDRARSRRSSSAARSRRPRATARAPPSSSRSATARCSTRSRTTRSPTCSVLFPLPTGQGLERSEMRRRAREAVQSAP